MRQFDVSGMSCAACSARVEKAVSRLEGVTACSVSLLTNSMGVEGTASDRDIISAVKDAGYGAKARGAAEEKADDALKDTETPKMKRRLFSSLGFLLALMYVSMGHGMRGWPLPAILSSPAASGLTQLLLAAVVMLINNKFFINGFKGLLKRAPNMDTLVALGSAASFIYSVCVLYTVLNGASGHYYFESAAMILTLITVGKMLEARSKGKTTDALKSLMKLKPQTATLLKDGKEVTVPIAEVGAGDVFCVRPGESVPADGIVKEGVTAVNEAALTGESVPVDKAPGDSVSAGTVNTSGYIVCEAKRVGNDTTLSQIIQMVSDASATKAPIAKTADRVAGVFVPAVLVIALVTLAVWLLTGRDAGFALGRAISVLVISCPCALGLATPVAIMVGSGVGARGGILFKTAAALEQAGRTEIIALDKTGTVTSGEPRVTDIVPCEGIDGSELLSAAASLERHSEHPLGRAIVRRAEEEGLTLWEVDDFRAVTGSGLTACLDGETLTGGSAAFAADGFDETFLLKAQTLSDVGKTPLFFKRGDMPLGVIAAADVLRPDSVEAIRQLKGMGIRTVLLTGDNLRTAKAIAKQAGIDEVIAGVLPQGKAEAISKLRREGASAMVGDGINDAPALTTADLGIAIGAGTDVAVDAADVVLMKSNLTDVPAAIRLGRRTLLNIRENLFWAFIYNIIGIPLAAGAYSALLGWEMNPMFGAAAMSLSSFCVVSNALRLNLVKLHDSRHDKVKKAKKKETKTMEKTMKIEGMMCGHCEARVKKTLEALEGVAEAKVSFKEGTAVVTLSGDVSADTLKAAVEAQDYKVLSVE